MYLWIDDIRNPNGNAEDYVVVRNAKDGIAALRTMEWDILYLDHDFGAEENGTGYEVACWIEQNRTNSPKKIVLLTSNPVGRENIARALASSYRRATPNIFERKW